MKTAWLIFQKDSRRFARSLALWLCFLAAESLEEASAWPQLPRFGWVGVLFVIRWLMLAVLVVSWVQEDRLVGDREFWQTRPVSPFALIGGKLIGLAVWFVVPSALAQTLAVAWLGTDPSHLFFDAVGAVIFAIGWCTCAAAIAAVTSSVQEWFVAVVLVCLGFAAVVSLPNHEILGRTLYAAVHVHGDRANITSIALAAAAFALTALVCQARFRRRGWTVAILLVGVVCMWDAVILWPLPVQRLVGPAAPADAATLSLQLRWPLMRTPFGTSPRERRWDWDATFRVVGASPGHFLAPTGVDSRWSSGSGDVRQWKEVAYTSNPVGEEDLISLFGRPEQAGGQTFPVALWRGYPGPPLSGSLESTIHLAEYQVTVAGRLPLTAGSAAHIPGSLVRISAVQVVEGRNWRTDPKLHLALSVELNVRWFNSWQRRGPANRQFDCFILTPDRRILALADSSDSSIGFAGSTAGSVRGRLQRLTVELPEGSSTNLSGMALLLVNRDLLGELDRTVRFEPVTLTPPDPTRSDY